MKSVSVIKMLLLFFGLLVAGCKTNQTKNQERIGKWIYKDTVNGIVYKSKGRYKKGIEVKTWKQFANGKCIKKEVYKNGICHTINYFQNGKIASIGQTKMIETKENVHWYYFGDWKFYDKNGKMTFLKKYENGELINEQEIQ